jgi:hypothetical protein
MTFKDYLVAQLRKYRIGITAEGNKEDATRAESGCAIMSHAFVP